MRGLFSIFVLLTILSLVLGGGDIIPVSGDDEWRDKIDSQVLAAAESKETEFLVILREQADLREASNLKTKLEKGTYVYQQLTEVAKWPHAPRDRSWPNWLTWEWSTGLIGSPT
jgi:hypothetical protein